MSSLKIIYSNEATNHIPQPGHKSFIFLLMYYINSPLLGDVQLGCQAPGQDPMPIIGSPWTCICSSSPVTFLDPRVYELTEQVTPSTGLNDHNNHAHQRGLVRETQGPHQFLEF